MLLLRELCDVAVCANTVDQKYVDKLKEAYDSLGKDDFVPRGTNKSKTGGPVFDAGSKETGRILMDLARQKMRLEGLKPNG